MGNSIPPSMYLISRPKQASLRFPEIAAYVRSDLWYLYVVFFLTCCPPLLKSSLLKFPLMSSHHHRSYSWMKITSPQGFVLRHDEVPQICLHLLTLQNRHHRPHHHHHY